MSSIITRTGVVLAGVLVLLTIGCSKERTPGVLLNPNTGKHPAQWETPAVHGAAAKGAASSTTGMFVCQECHNTDFTGGISAITCLNTTGCHGAGVKAPHSPAPWRGGLRTHVNTDQSNVPVCAQCHTNGANSTVQPSPFDPAAAPGCFNNTMCHGAVGHPPLWENPFYHGAAAKGAPGGATTTGFSYCQLCHGNDFTGGLSLQTCLNTPGCHGANVNAPHSPKPWRGATRTHTDTDPGNALVCAQCHTNGANSSVQPSSFDPAAVPGCFNNTLCHASVGHPPGWALPTTHGAAAKAAPSANGGFSLCQTCHGNDFIGGNALTSCLNTSSCHGAGVNAPHAKAWLPGSTYTHIDTDPGNASVCALCHTNGLNSPIPPPLPPAQAGTTPGCFNNTLCHAVPGHANPAAWSLPTGHGASAKAAPNVITISGFSTCQTCHNTDFTGGIALQTCLNTAGCHGVGVLAPHKAKPWLIGTAGSLGALSHVSTDPLNAPICALCHTNGANAAVAPSPPLPPAGTAPDCFNNTLCHAIPPLSICINCHTSPPNAGPLAGPIYPNLAGSHTVHNDATWGATVISCDTCHSSAGIGTPKHRNGTVDVTFLSAYNAKNGPAAYSSAGATCSNVSCHGGQTTPGWLSGAVIDVNTQCASCHVSGTTQYDSYFSGEHTKHVVEQNIACFTCHDITLLAVNHFTKLNTTTMEGPASATISSALNFVPGVTPNTDTCTPACHGTQTW